MAETSSSGASRQLPATLLPEILGFSPELLLDDLINCANDSIYRCVGAMEPFLHRWAAERSANLDSSAVSVGWSGDADVEKGLVAFQTLLEQHVDIAFDFFDVWCRRNIFTFSSDLPIVVPHHRGLDLGIPPEREGDLFTEMEDLRRRIENQRRLRSRFTRALAALQAHGQRSRRRSDGLAFLRPLTSTDMSTLPAQIKALQNSLKDLPPEAPRPPHITDPRKRPWEQSTEEYLHWAVNRLIERARSERGSLGSSNSVLSSTVDAANAIGTVQDIRMTASRNSSQL